MTTEEFWALVDRARSQADDGDAESVAEELVSLLVALPQEEIRHAERILDALVDRVNTVDLWAAAYAINGGCSDDGFVDFRGWLVAQGRAAFERVAADPDALADLPVVRSAVENGEDLSGESMVYAAWEAWEQVTGEDCPPEPEDDGEPAVELVFDDDFDDTEAVAARLPRLMALVTAAQDG
ncbi:DUF4240 domain-containing protein [Antribacter gilvus]|uniref:DUF4240 domain-containing protein n=1 Tax=Antribacter gilvus TaxID=2304675 RepID=UPI000F78429B|nr:DUF4240 domain-containing protein [Antribacter gilvus]